MVVDAALYHGKKHNIAIALTGRRKPLDAASHLRKEEAIRYYGCVTSSPAAYSSPARRSRLLPALALLLLLIILLLAAAALWFHHAAIAALPQLDGEISGLGLSAPVSVTRDAHGVPHIHAQNLHDLFFAQGFVTAQDRLWQMDVSRRYGRGELAEILGSQYVPLDVRQRTLQLRRVAEEAAAALPPEQLQLATAYADGVNALIARQKDLPIEFRVLRYAPRPWTVADSLTIGVNISQSLNTQYPLEHEREKLIAHLSPEEIADLYPNTSWRDHPPTEAAPATSQAAAVQLTSPDSRSTSPGTKDSLLASLGLFAPPPLAVCDSCFPGSNDWVVSGVHTVSGKPLLSNDMHLQHSIPSVWYEVQLEAGDFNAAGVSFPGMPFIVAGHNARIAWGFTNVGPDVQDMFIEKLDGHDHYLTPAGWQPLEHRKEAIHVSRAADVTLDVAVTRHGPIISALFPGETRSLSLEWSLYHPHALEIAFLDIDRATDWQSFLAAAAHFGGAAQNVVYADVDGHIGYHASGMIPIRAAGDGLLPQPGENDEHEWKGFIPFSELPSVFDPPSGIIATANGRITPDGYPYLIANEWGAPYRTERIYRLLSAPRKLTSADMLAIQLDVHSEFDRLCANAFVYGVDHAAHPSARARQAADVMRGWQGDMTVDSAPAALAVAARRKLWQLILEPKLGAAWEAYSWFNSGTAMEKLFVQRPARWLPKEFASWDELLAAAVERSLPPSGDLRSRRWGSENAMLVAHPLFGPVPILRRWASTGEQPQSGDGSFTVKAAGHSFGASERETVDLSDLDASNLNLVIGESGQIFSPYFMDHWPGWYGGRSFLLPFSEAAINKNAAHKLTLH